MEREKEKQKKIQRAKKEIEKQRDKKRDKEGERQSDRDMGGQRKGGGKTLNIYKSTERESKMYHGSIEKWEGNTESQT